MNLLFKGVTVVDPASQHNSKKVDVRIEKGLIMEIGKVKAGWADQVIDQGGVLSPGFFDMNATAGDPGYETKEDLSTLSAAASAGGFTGVALMPVAHPVVHNKAAVEYIINRSVHLPTDIKPVGALSLDLEGKELAELYDMHLAGAVAFTDGTQPVQNDGFMSRALQYANGFGGIIFSFPENRAMAGKAMIHESSNSIMLGMKGNPALAEELQISRDLFLAAYHEAPVHISTISTAGSVSLIKKAKKDGIKVTCDVAVHHLVLTEDVLEGFDSQYKVKPPLRGKADVKALLSGIKDGTIDAITTQHTPHEIECKAVEFETAAYGMIALQTALPLLLKAGLTNELIVDKLSIGPRRILGLGSNNVEVGNVANLVLFDPAKTWTYSKENNRSKSYNSPFLGAEMTGKVIATYNKKQLNRYE